MDIIKNSVININQVSAMCELECNLSKESVVNLLINTFCFSPLEQEFTIADLAAILIPSQHSSELKITVPVKGVVEHFDYAESRAIIDLYIFVGGIGDNPTSRNDIPLSDWEEAQKNVDIFWKEISKIFSLPPTRAYKHYPANNSYFDQGAFWNFCFIYLNDEKGQGVLLSGYCST